MKPGKDKHQYINEESDTEVSDQDSQDAFSEQDSTMSVAATNVYQGSPPDRKYVQMEHQHHVPESDTEVSEQDSYDVVPYAEVNKDPHSHREYDQYQEYSEPDSSASSDYDDEQSVYLSSDTHVVNSSILKDSQGNGKKKKLKGQDKKPAAEAPGTKRCKFLEYMKKKPPPSNYDAKDNRGSGEENSDEDDPKRQPHWYLVGRDKRKGEGKPYKGGLSLIVKKKV